LSWRTGAAAYSGATSYGIPHASLIWQFCAVPCAGAGVGKGRTIAGLVLENWRCGRRRHLWLTVGTDLKVDSRRDLDDVGAAEVPLHPLNKLPYGQLDSDKVRAPDWGLHAN
jgi:hypothetical protein